MPLDDSSSTLRSRIQRLETEVFQANQKVNSLQKSELRWRNFLNHLGDAAYETDAVGDVTYANPMCAALGGLPVEQIIGKSFLRLIDGKSQSLAREVFKKTLKGDQPEFELVFQTGRIGHFKNELLLDGNGKVAGVFGIARDITDQKAMKSAIFEREERLSLLVDTMNEGLSMSDRDCRFTYVNQRMCEMLKYQRSELLGQPVMNFVREDYREKMNVEIQRRKEGQNDLYEMVWNAKNGNSVYTLISPKGFFDDQGDFKGSIGVFTDISPRKKVEAALKESEDRYQTLYNNAMVGLAISNLPDGSILQCNDKIAEIFGYPDKDTFIREFVYTKHYLDPAIRDRLIKELKQRKEINNYEAHLKKRDGSPVWIRFTTRLYSEKGYMEDVVVDITEQKMALEAVKESEEHFRKVLETNPDPVIVYDSIGCVTYFNPAFANLFGWSLEEKLGKKMDVFVPEVAWPETRWMIDKVLSGESFVGIETRRYDREKRIIPVSISAAILKDRAGQPIGSVISLKDMSNQKTLEAQLFQAQKSEAIGTLAGGIAHDFNNLLMGIQGNVSLMLFDMHTDHFFREKLQNIESYVKSGSDLTRQLLGIAHGGKYEAKPIDINALVTRSINIFERTKKEITVECKLEEDLSAVEADQTQIEQVLLNIFINAWQAMPSGGQLNIQTTNANYEPGHGSSDELGVGHFVQIIISDTGVGMDETTQQKIFDPFFTTKERERGTGLGLASAYGIIKNHGGRISVRSEKGKGATFTILLPACDGAPVQKPAPSEMVCVAEQTVLIVDDEEMIIDVGREMLSHLGCDVIIARNGTEAVEVFREHKDRINLVILDMIMPGISGGEVFDELRSIDAHIKILLSSGYSIEGQAQEIMNRGCNGFIQKPFTMDQLSVKIKKIMDKP